MSWPGKIISICFFSFLFGSFISASERPVVFEVVGKFEYKSFYPDETLDKRSFRLSVSNACWKFTTFLGDDPNQGFRQCMASKGDGELFMAYYLEWPTNMAVVTLSSNAMPIGYGWSGVPHIWLMLASSTYLSQRTNTLLPMIFEPPSFNMYLLENSIVEKHSQFPFLPERIRYLYEGFRRSVDKDNRPRTYGLPPACAPGATNAIYEASEYTEVNGYSLPTKLLHIEYNHGNENGKSVLYLKRRIDVSIHTVRTHLTISNFLPDFPRAASIIDKRFVRASPRIEQIHYTLAYPKAWPTAKYSLEQYASTKRKTPAYFRVVFPILLVAPALVYLARYFWKRRFHRNAATQEIPLNST